MHAYLCVYMHILECNAYGVQKGESDPLKLKIEMVVVLSRPCPVSSEWGLHTASVYSVCACPCAS